MNKSRAIVIEGALGKGACRSSLRPASLTALAVEFPNDTIFVSFC